MTELTAISREAYRSLVDRPGFAAFFRAATPIDLIAGLGLGSRPTSRPGAASAGSRAARRRPRPSGATTSAALRAIPWVFAWSQARANLPGWYGLGHGARGGRRARRPRGRSTSWARLYRRWPFFASVLDNAELSLAKADLGTFRRYADLAEGAEARAIRGMIEAEYARSIRLLLLVTGRDRLLAGHPDARPLDRAPQPLRRRAVGRPGGAARAAPGAGPRRRPTRRRCATVIGVTINGIAAGLQNTGLTPPGGSGSPAGRI